MVSADDVVGPVELAIIKYSLHSSIKRTIEYFHLSEAFEFWPCLPEEIIIQIERLDHRKVSPMESIPAKVLKENFAFLLHI